MKYLPLLVMVAFCSSLFGQSISTKVDHVTVYRKGALVNRSGQISIKKGTTTYYFEDISSGVDPNSIRVAIKNDKAKVLSIEHEYSYMVNRDTMALLNSTDARRKALPDSILNIESRISVLESEISLLKNNSKIAKDGTNATALSQMVTYQRDELTSADMSILDLEKKKSEMQKERERLIKQVSQKSPNAIKKTSRVKLIVQSDSDIAGAKVSLDYLVYDASWYPTYDIRIKDTDKPLKLGYMARVSQSSNEDWKNVKLTLSTGNPIVDNVMPDFNTMVVGQTSTKRTSSWDRKTNSYYFGRVVDADGIGLKDVTVTNPILRTERTLTDKDGFFGITLSKGDNLWFSLQGYDHLIKPAREKMFIEMTQRNRDNVQFAKLGKKEKHKNINYDTEADEPVFLEIEAVADEEEISDDFSFRTNKSIKINTNVPLTLEQTMSSTDFAIDLPYTIPSGAVDLNVNMLSYEIDADYIYTSLPRISNDVYLMANIPDSYKYSLLEGKAKIYLNNVFEGETKIDPDSVQDTLSLSVGRDKGIAISREEVVSKNSKTILSGNRIEKTFEIVVKNNKKQTAHVEVVDQYPISEYKDVKITLTEQSGAKVDTETGKLLWNLELQPQEQRKLRFSYEIKCPKGRYQFKVQ